MGHERILTGGRREVAEEGRGVRKAGRKQECMHEGRVVRRQGSRTIGKQERWQEGCVTGKENARQVTRTSSRESDA